MKIFKTKQDRRVCEIINEVKNYRLQAWLACQEAPTRPRASATGASIVSINSIRTGKKNRPRFSATLCFAVQRARKLLGKTSSWKKEAATAASRSCVKSDGDRAEYTTVYPAPLTGFFFFLGWDEKKYCLRINYVFLFYNLFNLL